MKKLLIFICVIISANSFAQNNRISVQIQTRDCEYILWRTLGNNDWYTLDSALLSKGAEIDINAGTTLITVAGVPEKVWRDFMRVLRSDLSARVGNTVSRVDAALIALNISWLTTRLQNDEADLTTPWTNGRQEGRKRARKENNLSNN